VCRLPSLLTAKSSQQNSPLRCAGEFNNDDSFRLIDTLRPREYQVSGRRRVAQQQQHRHVREGDTLPCRAGCAPSRRRPKYHPRGHLGAAGGHALQNCQRGSCPRVRRRGHASLVAGIRLLLSVVQLVGIYFCLWHVSEFLPEPIPDRHSTVRYRLDWQHPILPPYHLRPLDGPDFRLGVLHVPHILRVHLEHPRSIHAVAFHPILADFPYTRLMHRVWMRCAFHPEHGSGHSFFRQTEINRCWLDDLWRSDWWHPLYCLVQRLSAKIWVCVDCESFGVLHAGLIFCGYSTPPLGCQKHKIALFWQKAQTIRQRRTERHSVLVVCWHYLHNLYGLPSPILLHAFLCRNCAWGVAGKSIVRFDCISGCFSPWTYACSCHCKLLWCHGCMVWMRLGLWYRMFCLDWCEQLWRFHRILRNLR